MTIAKFKLDKKDYWQKKDTVVYKSQTFTKMTQILTRNHRRTKPKQREKEGKAKDELKKKLNKNRMDRIIT
jgi:hypothetical protein